MTDTPRQPAKDIVVVGAGIVGVCCARWLQRDGHRITLLDAARPGSACSWGNAGVIATDMVLPVATPATFRALPRMLTDPRSPLAVRWEELPTLAPWLGRFLFNAAPRRAEANARVLGELCARAMVGYEPLLAGSDAAAQVAHTGWVTACEGERALRDAEQGLAQKRRHGVEGELLDARGVRERVPQLGDHVLGGAWYPDARMVADPGAFTAALADDVARHGGDFEQVRVERLEDVDDRVRIHTASGSRLADHVVVATGAHARELARTLGDDFPLNTERGYHAMLPAPELAPPMPVMSGDYAFVTTPMANGVRLAGTSELGGLDRPPTARRARMLVEQAQRLFPGLNVAGWRDWMGCRPTLPDSLPVIGRSPRCPAVSYAFGHQHLGLTLAGITGQLLADQLAGRPPAIDPAPVAADRF